MKRYDPLHEKLSGFDKLMMVFCGLTLVLVLVLNSCGG